MAFITQMILPSLKYLMRGNFKEKKKTLLRKSIQTDGKKQNGKQIVFVDCGVRQSDREKLQLWKQSNGERIDPAHKTKQI